MKASNPTTLNPATKAPELRLQDYRDRLAEELTRRLPDESQEPVSLHKAMRYAVLGGGKRMRPLLVYATGEALHIPAHALDAAACAVEIIHAHSLIHDDLPAMDDDELRRGHPTCHVAFGEATAILAGCALQALAFEVLSGNDALPRDIRLLQVNELAIACGSEGMAGGQAFDLAAVGRCLDFGRLERMHSLKTGALIRASVRIAALAREEIEPGALDALTAYGYYVGLAFQVQDDVLDESAPTEALGKTSGVDRARAKPTYPSVLGLEAAREHAAKLVDRALTAISDLGERAALLRRLANYAIERES